MTVEMDPADMTDEEITAVKLKKESDKQRAALDLQSRIVALQSRDGRRLLFRMLENCGMFNNCLAADRDTSLVLVGKHVNAVALWAELIATSPKLVGLMIEENAR